MTDTSLTVHSGGHSHSHQHQQRARSPEQEQFEQAAQGATGLPSIGDGIAKERSEQGGTGPAAFLTLSPQAIEILKKQRSGG